MSTEKLPQTNQIQLPDIFEQLPVLTSHNAGWSKISLEAHRLSPGETPKFALDHPVISINIGRKFYAEHTIENSRQGSIFVRGSLAICPMHCDHSFLWDKEAQMLSLNLQSELLNENATELLGIDNAKLIPHFGIQDGLIQQIGLALQAELQSNGMGGRLYAETMANALAVHLLQKYATKQGDIEVYRGGLSQWKLNLVTDYINDCLEQKLGLKELAAIAGLSSHHFCRAFKQSTGLTPHQYVIRQRVERAKLLLQKRKLNIAQVAIACGFTHQSHLHRHFKRLTGVTPKSAIDP